MLVLEVMSGRPALDLAEPSGMVLVTDWAWMLVKAGRTREVLAEALLREKDCRATVAAMERFVLVGLSVADEKVSTSMRLRLTSEKGREVADEAQSRRRGST